MALTNAGGLHVRTAGSGEVTTVLLHGLVATGDIFGGHFDAIAESGTLVVPDLLGFGRSIDESKSRFAPDDHLDALDAALAELGLADQPLRVGAHSMGASLALRWLERRGDQIDRIVCFGPPIYPDSTSVDATIASSGLMARAFVANTALARAACRVNCSHRGLAGAIAALATPGLPTPIARAASLHTWPAYRDAMDDLVKATDWRHLTKLASALDTSVIAIWGEHDVIGDRRFAAQLPGLECRTVAGGGHHLPLTHPRECLAYL